MGGIAEAGKDCPDVVVTGECEFAKVRRGDIEEGVLESTRMRDAGDAPEVTIGWRGDLKRPPGVPEPDTSPDSGLGVCAGVPYALFELEETGLASK